jgi:hypothetical protein
MRASSITAAFLGKRKSTKLKIITHLRPKLSQKKYKSCLSRMK